MFKGITNFGTGNISKKTVEISPTSIRIWHEFGAKKEKTKFEWGWDEITVCDNKSYESGTFYPCTLDFIGFWS